MATAIEAISVDVASVLADVIEITKELFPGVVSVEVVYDPEHPETRLTVIEAQAGSEAGSLIDRRVQWHDRISKLCGPGCSLCLSFKFEE